MTPPSESEVVVVGSGPAAAAAATRLVDGGCRVLVLEAGRAPEKNRFEILDRTLIGEIPWEFPHLPYEMRGDDIELNQFALRMLGGSSLAWGAITPRFHENDFRMRSRYGVAVDWPIQYGDLEPYYCQAEAFMGVSGAADNPYASHRGAPFPMSAFPMNDTDQLVKHAGSGQGIRFHSVPVARNSVPYGKRSACAYYGVCRACPIGAMYSSDHTMASLERRSNFTLITQIEVLRVEVDEGKRVSRIVYRDAVGREGAVRTEKVILATQAVENVRILLNSTSGACPSGLANDNGVLGRYFMEHAKFYVWGRVQQRLNPYRQGFETATSFHFHDHAERDDWAGGRILVREDAGPSVPQIAIESGLWGQALKGEIAEEFGHRVTLGAFLEQLPYAHNRITLSETLRTSSGLPAARIDFRLVDDYERRGFEELSRVMNRLLEAVGAEQIEVLMHPANSGHYMGGHRMGADPTTSTTDDGLQTHEVKNLYLASGGAFPTAGVSNPTLTTVALSLRMADRILGRV